MEEPPSHSSEVAGLPQRIETEADLDELLSRPTPASVEFIRRVTSPLLVLGAGGKMGPSLAVLARRAAKAAGHPLEVIAVSRFNQPDLREKLESHGVGTIAADLLDAAHVRKLPESANLLYMVGLKFGTSRNPSATWAINTLVPALVCERYSTSRIAALSTGNVYPMSPANAGGSIESDALIPLGEYANAAVARERIFEFESRRRGTPVALLRLFYAVELRYGVLVDLARMIHRGDPVPLANGVFTCIWQRDANEMALRSLALANSPPTCWNLCQPEVFSIRETALKLGALLGRPSRFEGSEAPTALAGNAQRICESLGSPATPMEAMLRWTAHWVAMGGACWDRPTHFEVRDGQY